jgi:hypothetical protein
MIATPAASHQSLVLLLGGDGAPGNRVEDWLGPLGWICAVVAGPADLSGIVADQGDLVPALALLDGRGIDAAAAAEWIAAIRSLPGLAAGTPVLLLDDAAAPGRTGVAARIDMPFDPVSARPVIEHWAGPLADHGFRSGETPHYRLVRLAGRVQAEALMRGFAEQLEEVLASAARGEALRSAAHRLAGVAGIIGFGELTPLWSAVDREDSGDATAALKGSRTVLDRIRRDFPKA